ncbi:hypothetical protein GJV44_00459 [Candidatus Vallotia cooleyia]|nr:hypothetical protein GJV44_00459 [Candidatus Vallotia cooleyia]
MLPGLLPKYALVYARTADYVPRRSENLRTILVKMFRSRIPGTVYSHSVLGGIRKLSEAFVKLSQHVSRRRLPSVAYRLPQSS